MSISSRITQMEQHIGNAYDKIEDLGIDLTDVDKNIDNIATMLEDVWNKYPKVSATDVEEASIDGTKKGRMNIDLKGQTEQEQLTGKNLLDISKVNSSTNDNLINNGDGTLKVKGYGVSAGSPNNLKTYCPTLQVGDEVIISADTTSSNKFIYLSGTNTSWAFGTTRTITQSDLDSIVLWYGASGGDTNYYTISNIMVRKSSVTDSSYEPYCGGIPSPNPEFPQQIKNVTGNSNVKIQNKNLFTSDYSQFNSTGGEGTLYDYFKLPENDKVYTISVIAKNDFTPTRTTYLGFSGNGGDANLGTRWVIAGTSTSTITKGTKISINNLDNEKNLRYVSMYTKGATNLKNFTDNFEIQLEQGSTATSYVPHQEQNYPFSLKSKNLFNPNEEFENGYYNINGSFTPSSSWRCMTVKCKQGDTFVKSGTRWGGNVTFWNNDTFVSGINSSSVTIPIGVNKVKFACQYPFNGDEQLEEGTTATDYEPYYEYELCKIDTVQDYFYKQNDKWYLHKEIDKVVFNGSSNVDVWGNATQVGTSSFYRFANSAFNDTTKYKSLTPYISDKFIFDNVNSLQEKNVISNTGATGLNRLWITIDTTLMNGATVEDFKTWLSTHNTEVYYQLATPTDIEITETTLINQLEAIKKAKSYDDQTNISQTNDELPFILDIEALKGETTNEVKLLTSNNRKTTEYLETSLEPEKVEKIEEVEEPKEVEIPEEEVDTEENTESTAENAENSAESEEK